jgi:hypothetical protein
MLVSVRQAAKETAKENKAKSRGFFFQIVDSMAFPLKTTKLAGMYEYVSVLLNKFKDCSLPDQNCFDLCT